MKRPLMTAALVATFLVQVVSASFAGLPTSGPSYIEKSFAQARQLFERLFEGVEKFLEHHAKVP